MSPENAITLAAAVLAFLASIVATAVSLYTTRFTRFAKERWWERKAEAYTRITEAIAGLVYYVQEHYNAELERRELSEERRREISEYWRKGYIQVKQAAATAPFLISADAKAALSTFWKEHDAAGLEQEWVAILEADYDAAHKCLDAFVLAAKADLELG